MAITALFVSLGAFAVITYLVSRIGLRARNLPPGPPTVPIFGNALQIPTGHAYVKLTEWGKTYGGIFSLKLGPHTMIVLNDRRHVKELLDKRSAIYSARPPFYVGQLVGGGDHILFMGNDNRWRAIRKALHNFLKESVVMSQHLTLVDAEAVQMCRDFLIEPEGHMAHPKRYSHSVARSMAYGVRTASSNTPYMVRFCTVMDMWIGLVQIGSVPPVDQVPLLKYLPEMFFNNWKSRARFVQEQLNEVFAEALEDVIHRRGEKGINKGSFADTILDNEESLGFGRHQMNFLAGNLMEAASDTTAANVHNFIRAMIKWPEVMRKAQLEIDSVVGEDRSPTFHDYDKLPYVAAVMKETMRWRPAAPLGVAHAVIEDDYIDGFLIPKGATIVQNIWGLHHDETYFPDPETFDPDRYAGITLLAPDLAAAPDYRDRDHFAYGAGRKLCPGIHLAEREVYVGLAKILWGFDMLSEGEKGGKALDVDVERTCHAGAVLSSLPYQCEMRVRSEKRRQTILREFEIAEKGVFTKYDE